MISSRPKAAMVVLTLISFFSCQKELHNPDFDTPSVRVYFISTYAGTSSPGNLDGPAKKSTFKAPFGIASSANGTLFITDNGNNNIRKISPDGLVEAVMPVGSLGGPSGVEVCADGVLYICESQNNRIVKVSTQGKMSELRLFELGADGVRVKTSLNSPNGLTMAPDGSIYVAETFNNKIRKISKDGLVTVVAGSTAGYKDGPGTEAMFSFPFDVALDKDGSIYVSDYGNNAIRKISTKGVVSTVAGSTIPGDENNVIGLKASFRSPTGLAIGEDGTIYIADYYNSQIRAILTTGEVVTIAGTDDGFLDGVGITAKMFQPVSLVIHENKLYITDSKNFRIRSIVLD